METQTQAEFDFQIGVQRMREAFLAEDGESAYRIKAEIELEVGRGLVYGRRLSPKLCKLFKTEEIWSECGDKTWFGSMYPTKEEGDFLEKRYKQRREYEVVYKKALDMVNGVIEFDSCDFEKCLEFLTTEDCNRLLEALDKQQSEPETKASEKAEPLEQTFWKKLINIFKNLIGKI